MAVWGSGIRQDNERRPLPDDHAKEFLRQLAGLV